MKTPFMIMALTLALSVTAYGGQKNKLFLLDGSTVEGEIVSFLNGIYTVNTQDRGQLKIGASKIRKMETVETPEEPATIAPAAQNTAASMKSEVDKVSATIAASPEMSGKVASLAADPAIQNLLNDPEIVQAIKTGNIQALMANPKFMELVNNQKIKELSNQVKDQKPQ